MNVVNSIKGPAIGIAQPCNGYPVRTLHVAKFRKLVTLDNPCGCLVVFVKTELRSACKDGFP